MSDKTKKAEADETMRILREVFGEKLLGEYVELSSAIDDSIDCQKAAIEEIAESLRRAAVSRGAVCLPETAKIFIKKAQQSPADPLGARSALGAKIQTIMDTSPQAFMAFIAYWLKDCQSEVVGLTHENSAARARYEQLIAIIHSAKRLSTVREYLVDAKDYEY